jgi:hypothetical protein
MHVSQPKQHSNEHSRQYINPSCIHKAACVCHRHSIDCVDCHGAMLSRALTALPSRGSRWRHSMLCCLRDFASFNQVNAHILTPTPIP